MGEYGLSDSKTKVHPENQHTVLHADIVIVGAGIAGLATALALHRSGIRSLILERAKKLRTGGTSIGLWANAWRALEALEVADFLRKDYMNIERVEMLDKDGNLKKEIHLQDTMRWNHELRCVERRHLLEVLARPLPSGTIRFNSRVLSIEKGTTLSSTTTIRLQDGTNICTKVLIGCDGSHSLVSEWLGLPPPKLAGYYTIRGVSTYAEGHNSQPVFQQIVGDGIRAGIAPIDATRVYWFISNGSSPEVPQPMLESKNIREEALNMLEGFPNSIIELVKRTDARTMIASTIWLRWLWPHSMMDPNFSQGGVTVAGDAMHPMPPDLAQGGCCALEDAVVLARLLSKATNLEESLPNPPRYLIYSDMERKIAEALKKYTQERRERVWSLTAKALLVGKILNANSSFLHFLRDSIVLPTMQASMLVAHTQFECGPL